MIVKPGTTALTKSIRAALIIRAKSPNVIKVKGKASSIRMGFMKVLTKPIKILTTIAVVKVSRFTPERT